MDRKEKQRADAGQTMADPGKLPFKSTVTQGLPYGCDNGCHMQLPFAKPVVTGKKGLEWRAEEEPQADSCRL